MTGAVSLFLIVLSEMSGRVAPQQASSTLKLQHIDELSQVAEVEGAGAERGPHWYSYNTETSKTVESNNDDAVESSLSVDSDSGGGGSGSGKKDISKSMGASSVSTQEKKLLKRVYRECAPCALDMIRRHTNRGIIWICGEYQRAQRSFKSECMMRYRNCQDGTLFIKVANHRCREDKYHGRHWFYNYKV